MRSKITWLFIAGFFLVTQFSFAQQKEITGTITDEGGLPLPGVSVLVQGTNIGTQTNFDGVYRISANPDQVLVFSFIGFITQSVKIGTKSVIAVTLKEDMAELDEVVVMGYVSLKPDQLTSSAPQVDAEVLEQNPVATVDQALQGRVAGLTLSSGSGTPGSTTDIRIRGISSITAGNEPLYVVNGVPVTNANVGGAASGSSLSALASFNSNDIESITVLKDASATAAYGARGANGVIVITTKSGKEGKTSFNLSTSYGFSNDAIKGPEVLTAAERETLYYESIYNTYGEANTFSRAEAQQFYEANAGNNGRKIFSTDYVNWNAAGRPEANWESVISNSDAPIKEYNISATGGDETHNFYASLGRFEQEATVIGSDFERTSGSLNFTKNLSKTLKFSSANTGSYTYQDGLLEGSAYFSSPRTVKYFMPPTDQPYNDDGSINLNTSLPNPLWISQEDIDDSKFTRILTNNSLAWQMPIKNLTFNTRVSIDYQVYNYKRYRNRISGDGASTDGYGYQSNRTTTNYVFQNYFDYLVELGNSNFNFTILQEYQKNRRYLLEADAEYFPTDGLTNLATAGSPTTASSEFDNWSVASYLATMGYSYDSRYVVNATYRREGSSRFAASNRWGNFYSIGGAWNIHREAFFSKDLVNMLKLRASYGVTGNADIGLNSYQVLFNYDSDYAGTAAAYPAGYGNEDLTWETSKTFDVGIDFGLFQNRLNGSVAYYKRKSEDLLLNVPLSLTSGFATQTRNIGRMENSGFELELGYDFVRSNDFNVSLSGNLATVDNKVLELAKDANDQEINITNTATRVESGHPVNGWYLPTWAGVDPATGADTWYVDGEGSETTTNFNNANRVFQGGSALPTLTAGLNLHIDFKGFFIDANGYYAGGQKVYESWHRYTQGQDRYSLDVYQGINTLLDRWQEPGDITRIGKLTYTAEPWRYSSKFLFDGDYIRLKFATFGYNFQSEVVNKIGLNGLRLFIRGSNLLTWVKDDNLIYDPEVNASGFTDMNTPPVKSFIFGVNIKL